MQRFLICTLADSQIKDDPTSSTSSVSNNPHEYRRYAVSCKVLANSVKSGFPVYRCRFARLYPFDNDEIENSSENMEIAPGQYVMLQTQVEIDGEKQWVSRCYSPFRGSMKMFEIGKRTAFCCCWIGIDAVSSNPDVLFLPEHIFFVTASDFVSNGETEVDIHEGDKIYLQTSLGRGIAFGLNLRTGQECCFPMKLAYPQPFSPYAKITLINCVQSINDVFGEDVFENVSLNDGNNTLSVTHIASEYFGTPTSTFKDGLETRVKRGDVNVFGYLEQRYSTKLASKAFLSDPLDFEDLVHAKLTEIGFEEKDISVVGKSSNCEQR
ncbi:hypothetical protein HK098_007584 [Nowakowskiella sp. JEL0407]|nr:hypothetical protein HK098_007584 [Nowakowskiella sp. JEL0407]